MRRLGLIAATMTMLILGVLMITIDELIFNPLQELTNAWRRPAQL